MKLYICNRKKIEQIIKDKPFEDWFYDLSKQDQIEYLANVFIADHINEYYNYELIDIDKK